MSKNLINSLTINGKYQRKWISSDRTLNFQSLHFCCVNKFCWVLQCPQFKKFKIESLLMGSLEDLSLLCTYYNRKWRHMETKEVIGDSQCGFNTEKSCHTKLVAFYDGTGTLVDEKREIYLVYLVLCKAFDAVLLAILVPKVKTHGFDRWDTQ